MFHLSWSCWRLYHEIDRGKFAIYCHSFIMSTGKILTLIRYYDKWWLTTIVFWQHIFINLDHLPTWVSSRKYRLSSAVWTSAGRRNWIPFRIRLTISLSLSRNGLLCVNTPGLFSLWNLVELVRFNLDGDLLVVLAPAASPNRTRFGQCWRAWNENFQRNISNS